MSLAQHKLYYEDLTHKKPERVGRPEMTKSTSTEAPKASKKYQKTRGEHAKDILIAVLVTAVIAFIGGMHFANKHNAEMQNAVKAASTPVAQAEVKK